LGAALKVIAQQEHTIAWLTARLEKQLRARFGQSSEAVDPATLLPFAQDTLNAMLAAGEAVSEQVKAEQAQAGDDADKLKDKPKRKPIPANIPRVRIVHSLPEAERKCPCCGEAETKIGEVVTEQLEYVPASFKVLQHIQEKYACGKCRNNGCAASGCEGHVMQAPKPPQAIEKSLAGPGLLAHVATSKYGDHLPMHRLEGILERCGLEMSRSTLCGWMMQAEPLFEGLLALMKKTMLQSLGVQMDDTPVKMLDPQSGKGKTHLARCWTYQGDELRRFTLFDFQLGRGEEHPTQWFKDTGYQGHGQCDAYDGYNGVFGKTVNERENAPVPMGCWAHVRRRFFDADKVGEKDAKEMIHLLQKLYAIEKAAKADAGLHPDGPTHAGGVDPKGKRVTEEEVKKLWSARKARRKESRKILDEQIKPWLEAKQATGRLIGRMADAVGYALNQWDRLTVYAEHGHIEIDNNAMERALRCVAIGRKNWLFAGNARGGKTLATFMSVIASGRQYGHDPYAYLRDLFEKLPALREAGWPEEELRKLLPDQWAAPTAPK